jgi:hypothetical protein
MTANNTPAQLVNIPATVLFTVTKAVMDLIEGMDFEMHSPELGAILNTKGESLDTSKIEYTKVSLKPLAKELGISYSLKKSELLQACVFEICKLMLTCPSIVAAYAYYHSPANMVEVTTKGNRIQFKSIEATKIIALCASRTASLKLGEKLQRLANPTDTAERIGTCLPHEAKEGIKLILGAVKGSKVTYKKRHGRVSFVWCETTQSVVEICS